MHPQFNRISERVFDPLPIQKKEHIAYDAIFSYVYHHEEGQSTL